jgi:hypothetical protein
VFSFPCDLSSTWDDSRPYLSRSRERVIPIISSTVQHRVNFKVSPPSILWDKSLLFCKVLPNVYYRFFIMGSEIAFYPILRLLISTIVLNGSTQCVLWGERFSCGERERGDWSLEGLGTQKCISTEEARFPGSPRHPMCKPLWNQNVSALCLHMPNTAELNLRTFMSVWTNAPVIRTGVALL